MDRVWNESQKSDSDNSQFGSSLGRAQLHRSESPNSWHCVMMMLVALLFAFTARTFAVDTNMNVTGKPGDMRIGRNYSAAFNTALCGSARSAGLDLECARPELDIGLSFLATRAHQAPRRASQTSASGEAGEAGEAGKVKAWKNISSNAGPYYDPVQDFIDSWEPGWPIPTNL